MVPIVPMSMVPMVPVFAKEATKVAKDPSKVAKDPSKVAKEPSTVAKEPSLVTKEASKVAKDPAMSPWAKRCNFYSYDGRKDVTLRNRNCEILTKSRKPPKVEDFVSSLKSQVSSLGLESRSEVSVASLESRSRVSVRSLGPESRSESVSARMSMSMVSDSSGRPCLHEVEVFGAKIYID